MRRLWAAVAGLRRIILSVGVALVAWCGPLVPTPKPTMSNFEIFPSVVQLYPADVQTFTIRGTPPSAGWRTLTNGTLQSDYTLVYTGSGGLLRGNGLHYLKNGIGRVTLTVTPQSLPTSTGVLSGYLFDTGSGAQLWFDAEATQITVKKLPTLTTLATVSHTLASGDELALEMAGDRWRFYLNGTEQAGFTPASANRYPGTYKFEITPPVSSGTATLPVPILGGTGEWYVPFSDWAATGGTPTSDTGTATLTYTAGTRPGVYTITSTVESSPQQATATVIIPPLSILSETTIEVEPSAEIFLKTNYDAAQTSLVTWSVVSGSGSFSRNKFTAPSAPGSTVVKAVYGNQEARITITIPARMTITASGISASAATPSEVLTLTTNMTGTINWTASTGTLSSATGGTVTWTAPGADGLEAIITATNGTYTVTKTISVLNAFPYRPNLPLKWERKKTVLVSPSEDRSRRFSRVKNTDDTPFEAHELVFQNRSLAELAAVQDFWDEHYPGKRFILTEYHRGIRLVLWFDSDIAHDANATCATTYSFRAVEG